MKKIAPIISCVLISIGTVFIFYSRFPSVKNEPIYSSNEYIHYLDSKIPGLIEDYKIPGAIIVLVHEGEIIWSKAYGYADTDSGRKMDVDAICRVESISKSLTAWGVIKLVNQGLVDLDAPLSSYLNSWQLPESEFSENEITVRRLLSANAGMPLGSITEHYDPAETFPALREMLSDWAVPFKDPGSGFYYSNVGYALLELMIENVTGRDFAEYMKNEVLTPLGMKNSTFSWDESIRPVLPLGYRRGGEAVSPYVYSDKAAGGLFATAEDIARFTIAGMYDSCMLHEPQISIPGYYGLVADSYGFGHFIETRAGGVKSVAHGGQGDGLMTYFMSVPESGDSFVLLTNSQRSWPFMSWLLNSWGAWVGLPTVGMGIIEKILDIVWLFIGLLFFFVLTYAWSVIRKLMSNKIAFAPFSRKDVALRIVKATGGLVIVVCILVLESLDYFFLFSVFPIASTAAVVVLLLSSAIIFYSACTIKK